MALVVRWCAVVWWGMHGINPRAFFGVPGGVWTRDTPGTLEPLPLLTVPGVPGVPGRIGQAGGGTSGKTPAIGLWVA
ncbi:MAG: hypothetical protein IPK97_16330 [Ahniella sp.]|nr:hypothetical protein [Ahniella sp.]